MNLGSSDIAHKLIAWLGVLVATGGFADFVKSALTNEGVPPKIIDAVIVAIGALTTILKMWRDSTHNQAVVTASINSNQGSGLPQAAPDPGAVEPLAPAAELPG